MLDVALILHPAFLVILLFTGNIGGDGGDGRYAKSKLQKTASLIEVEPLNIYQSTRNYVLLAALIFPK
jgi:hypothetical protein